MIVYQILIKEEFMINMEQKNQKLDKHIMNIMVNKSIITQMILHK